MKVPLHFGEAVVTLEIPDSNLSAFIQPAASPAAVDGQRFAEAVGSGLEQLRQQAAGASVGMLLPDGTRGLGIDALLAVVLPLLENASRVLFFICTGSHPPRTAANAAIIDSIDAQAAAAGIADYDIIAHDCREADFVSAGVTSRGTDVQVNARLDEVDVFLGASDVKHHYFAGYSNPIKNIVPGLCAFKTIQQNHSFTFDARSAAGIHPWHPDKDRRDNPLAADQLEALGSVLRGRPFWALVMTRCDGLIQWVDCGPAQTVTARAFAWADEHNAHSVEPTRYMVVAPGGAPNDVDLYIAQRALELTCSVVADGGRVLFLAACPNGVGSELTQARFADKLIEPLDAILQADRTDYQLFDHKPYRFAALIRRLEALQLYTQIPAATVRQMHMLACEEPQAAVDRWIQDDPDAEIVVVDGANRLLLHTGP